MSRRFHRHTCPCGNSWEHGSECAGSEAAHTCSECGNEVYVRDYGDGGTSILHALDELFDELFESEENERQVRLAFEIYRRSREYNTTRESLRITAIELNKTPEQIAVMLGFDRSQAHGS